MYFSSVHVKEQLLLSRSMQVKASFCTYALQTLDRRLLICSSKCLRLYKIFKDYIKIIQKNPPRSLKTLEFCNSSEKKKKKNGCLVILELGTNNKEVEKIYFWRIFTKLYGDLLENLYQRSLYGMKLFECLFGFKISLSLSVTAW